MPQDLDFAAPLRDALHTADFTYDRVAEAIGEDAHRALGPEPEREGWVRVAERRNFILYRLEDRAGPKP